MEMKLKHLGFFLLLLLSLSCQQEDPVLGGDEAVNFIDLTYGDDSRQKMDVYLPAGRNKSRTKVLIWIHGGAWTDGNKSEFAGFKPWLEEVQEDYAYIAINYRLFDLNSRRNSFPTQEQDILSAIQFIKSNLSNWNVSDQVILAGGSAGGHLALLHSYKNNNEGLVKAVVAFFPPTELKALFNQSFFSQLLLASLIGGTPTSHPDAFNDSSPVNFINRGDVPTAFFHGELDTVVPISQSFLLEETLRSFEVPYVVEYVPNQGHGFTQETYRDLIKKMEAFLQRKL
jgi:dipeptidyl aminopeptidase/acylaminoacyl peptidase